MPSWRHIVDGLNVSRYVYVWKTCSEKLWLEPGFNPFKSPALRGQDSNVCVVEVTVLVNAILVDGRVMPDSRHQSQAQVAVHCGYAPTSRDQLSLLALSEHSKAESSL